MKKLPDRYMFPAVLTYEPNQDIAVVFHDIETATSGKTDFEAISAARECLGGVLALMEESGEPIPEPTPLSEIQTKPNERAILIDVYMPSIRLASVNRAVTRTVTVPAWLNAAALERGFNFSQVLQEALKERMGITNITG